MAGGKLYSIDGCDRPVVARGWCHAHWQRWRRHGEPLGTATDPTVIESGTRFGRLVVTGFTVAANANGKRFRDYDCVCDCGASGAALSDTRLACVIHGGRAARPRRVARSERRLEHPRAPVGDRAAAD